MYENSPDFAVGFGLGDDASFLPYIRRFPRGPLISSWKACKTGPSISPPSPPKGEFSSVPFPREVKSRQVVSSNLINSKKRKPLNLG
jgi:hypothetical protein